MVPKAPKRIPFAYRFNEETWQKELVPEWAAALKQAKKYINQGSTFQSVVDYLYEKTGKKITLAGLRKAIQYKAEQRKGGQVKHKSLNKKGLTTRANTKPTPPDELRAKELGQKHRIGRMTTGLIKHTTIVTDKDVNDIPEEIKEDVLKQDVNIVFEPNPGPQTEFLAATEKEVLYGGARGGGKSYSLIVDPLRYCHKPLHRALIIRKTMPELRDMIAHAHRLYRQAFPEVKWKEQEKVFTFPSGARIEFGFAENEMDATRYQGQAYTWIGVDEIGLYASDRILTLLKGSLRSVDPEIPTYIRMSCNPGGPGMHWIKEQYVDAAEWNTTFYVPVEQGDGTTQYITRRFIPAKLIDNPYLNNTPDYKNMLLSLPEKLKKMWLFGSWNVVEGAAFEEFDPEIHVVEPFDIPSSWPRMAGIDWGFSTNFCVLWMASDYEGTIYVYREWYNKGLTADIFAQRARMMEGSEYVQYRVIDSSAFSRRGDIGPPVPEIMRQNGFVVRPSDRSPGSRRAGKMEIHRRLRIVAGEDGKPTAKLKIFKTCRNLIRTLPVIPLDPNDLEDVDTKAEDHAIDALRYAIMSRPMNPVQLEYLQQAQRNEQYRPADRRVGY